MSEDRRARGIEMMKRVYGWDIGDVSGDFVEQTVDQLFGEIWARETMTIRERRLLLIGLLVGRGLDDVVELQLDAALRLDELNVEELREIVVFLTYYGGWPHGAKLNQVVEKVIAQRERERERGETP